MKSSWWALIQYDLCPFKYKKHGHERRERQGDVMTQGQTAPLQAKKEAWNRSFSHIHQKEPTSDI